ncbi:ABC transporter six-transmembrane domain-containing protein [Vibrio sonorensis]|uniref:ABC transporter six-transmembrane domain-containing protein n=1 Tax=Vibrio sonorensis TaxID=1004316 RepID=UPI0008DAEF1E|nr:ABC transporter six-transmembrane domain-containing protein [Vibrio sonorensis]
MGQFSQRICLKEILKRHKAKVACTWLLVAIENAMMVMLPLVLGMTIDGLLEGEASSLYQLTILAGCLVLLSVIRHLYDTRAYGAIRVQVGTQVHKNLSHLPVSSLNARLSMSRELVDFLEHELPPMMTASIQLIASVIILSTFHFWMALSAIAAGVLMLMIYGLFHQHFVRLNTALNNQMERQVNILAFGRLLGVKKHLEKIKRREILLSDTEAIVYGLIFALLFAFVIVNLWLVTHFDAPTSGQIFSSVTYSLEFLEAAILLPITLQSFSRLTEITHRLNGANATNLTHGEVSHG